MISQIRLLYWKVKTYDPLIPIYLKGLKLDIFKRVVGQFSWKAFLDFYVRLLNYKNAHEDTNIENVGREENI